MSKSAAARLFGVSVSSVKHYARIANRGASLEPRKSSGRPPKADEIIRRLLEEDVKECPTATVSETQFLGSGKSGIIGVPHNVSVTGRDPESGEVALNHLLDGLRTFGFAGCVAVEATTGVDHVERYEVEVR